MAPQERQRIDGGIPMTTRRKLVVKAQGPEARATFSIEAHRGMVWVTVYDCPHVCVAILDPAHADHLVELIQQTTAEARGYRKDASP